MKAIDKEENVSTECAPTGDVDAARRDLKSLRLATMNLPSGAVQDAQQMAKLAPMGVIFVPSRDGISHSPKEFTAWVDVGNGRRCCIGRWWSWMWEWNHQRNEPRQ
jgi:acetylornithine deacetylase/succinyl-diaminopimelate desuccinylase-like protein